MSLIYPERKKRLNIQKVRISNNMIYKPLSVQFELTESCTHRCRHCYNYYSHAGPVSKTNEKVIENVAKQEFFDITLTGGEPLCAKEQMYQSIDLFRKENMDVRINSNLHLLTEEDADKIAEKGVTSILSSILGPNEELHETLTGVIGSFKTLERSLDYLTKQNLSVALNMVVTKKNLQEVYNTGKFALEKFGLTYFCATPMVVSPGKDLDDLALSKQDYIHVLNSLLNLEQNLNIKVDSLHPAVPCMFPQNEQENYRKFFERRACAAGTSTLTISPRGDVRVCSQENRNYGNIIKTPLETILENMNCWRERAYTPKECLPCEYLNLCKGGCRVSAEVNSGKLDGLEPYFSGPVKKTIFQKEEKIDFEKLKSQRGNPRVREELNDLTTVYISPGISAILNPLELIVFRRFLSGKKYSEILKEMRDKIVLDQICANLVKRKLLI